MKGKNTECQNRDSLADALYSAYLTGKTGFTTALLLFSRGVIIGMDIGAGVYDGEYRTATDNGHLIGTLRFTLPAGISTITGVTSPERQLTFSVPLDLPLPLDEESFVRIETGVGPVNVRFKKLRDV